MAVFCAAKHVWLKEAHELQPSFGAAEPATKEQAMLRLTVTTIAIAALATILAGAAIADETKCAGTIITIDGDTVTLKDMVKEDQQHQMKIEPATKISSVGKPVMPT